MTNKPDGHSAPTSGQAVHSDTPLTDALQDEHRGDITCAPIYEHARKLETDRAELLEMLKLAAAKLRFMAHEFAKPNFTDRYNDGPSMLNIAEKADAAIARATAKG